MKRNIFICLITISLINPCCSKEKVALNSSLTITPVLSHPTKALADDNSITSGEIGLQITTTDGDIYSSGLENIKLVKNSSWALETPVYLSSANARLFAYFPYTNNSTIFKGIGNDANYLLNIPSSQKMDSQTDYLWGCQDKTTLPGGNEINNSNPSVNLKLNHALAQLSFVIYKENYNGPGNLSKIEVKDNSETPNLRINKSISNDLSMKLLNGTITGGETVSNINITDISKTISLTSNPGVDIDFLKNQVLAYALLVPTAILSKTDIQMNFTIDNKVYPVSLSGAGEQVWSQGNQYIYVVKLLGREMILQSVTVTPWSNSVMTSGVVGVIEKMPESNCYIVDSESKNRIFLIPTSRVENGINAVNAAYGSQIMTFNKSNDWSPEIVWQTWNPTISGNRILVSKYSDDYIKIEVPKGVNGNNALIALKQGGVILWSWHLWITDYSPAPNGIPGTLAKMVTHKYAGDAFSIGGIMYNKVVMDRNLGATWTGPDPILPSIIGNDALKAVKAYGLFYQWGRKDPFPSSADGTSLASTLYKPDGTQLTINITAVSASNNLPNAVRNPVTFYSATANPFDWYTTLPESQNQYLWNSQSGNRKTIFDPCPSGWRVPLSSSIDSKNNPWSGFCNGIPNSILSVSYVFGNGFDIYINGLNVTSGFGPTAGRLYTMMSADASSSGSAWYPFSGYMKSTGLGYVGNGTNYWTGSLSNLDKIIAKYSYVSVSPFYIEMNESYGYLVRCVQE
ncbi:MAG: fimbrillin family protein [Bacteroidales bacterium]